MVTPEKIREVKKLLTNGVPEGEIKQDLHDQGYSKEEIDKIFTPHKYDMRSWYAVFAIILFLTGLWMLFKNGSLLILVLSGLLFYAYHKETERLKKQ